MNTPANRYHICLSWDDVGDELYTTETTKAAAFKCGRRVKQIEGDGCQVTVFDSMAHKGAERLWEITQGDSDNV